MTHLYSYPQHRFHGNDRHTATDRYYALIRNNTPSSSSIVDDADEEFRQAQSILADFHRAHSCDIVYEEVSEDEEEDADDDDQHDNSSSSSNNDDDYDDDHNDGTLVRSGHALCTRNRKVQTSLRRVKTSASFATLAMLQQQHPSSILNNYCCNENDLDRTTATAPGPALVAPKATATALSSLSLASASSSSSTDSWGCYMDLDDTQQTSSAMATSSSPVANATTTTAASNIRKPPLGLCRRPIKTGYGFKKRHHWK